RRYLSNDCRNRVSKCLVLQYQRRNLLLVLGVELANLLGYRFTLGLELGQKHLILLCEVVLILLFRLVRERPRPVDSLPVDLGVSLGDTGVILHFQGGASSNLSGVGLTSNLLTERDLC